MTSKEEVIESLMTRLANEKLDRETFDDLLQRIQALKDLDT